MAQTAAWNCPACGTGVASDQPNCRHCGVRLATLACPSCLGMMFLGSKHCPRCGEVAVEWLPDPSEIKCPHCSAGLFLGHVGTTAVHECGRCFGLWLEKASFDAVCRDRGRQAAVLTNRAIEIMAHENPLEPIRYRKCPTCAQSMNRTNYARYSGVIIDVCVEHGVWFDRDELQRIVVFIKDGGLDRSRRREMDVLSQERARLRDARPEGRMSMRSHGSGGWLIVDLLEIGIDILTSFLR